MCASIVLRWMRAATTRRTWEARRAAFPNPPGASVMIWNLLAHCEERFTRGVSEKEITLKRGSWG